MESAKPLEFNASPSTYFMTVVVTALSAYVPFFGWASGFNYMANWAAENTRVNGKAVVYQAEYLETLKFITIGALLTFITFGIYIFWFAPKAYRYAADHIRYKDEVAEILQTQVAKSSAASEQAQPPIS
ncbi:MAG TPA: DUF898 family protein [Candidatus Saccharimonadales bacterium]|nr:DUF898 family protein [Candidatus Saccharimonadales bacterium]